MRLRIKYIINNAFEKILFNSFTIFLFLTTIALLEYIPSLYYGFAEGDDEWMLMYNVNITNFNFLNYFKFYTGQFQPLYNFFYYCIHSIFGLSPEIYHGISLLFHLFNLGLFLIAVKKILYLLKIPRSSNYKFHLFVSGLLFITIPVNIEAVVWFSATKTLLYTFFFLLAVINYINFLDNRKTFSYLLTVIFYLLSYFSKEQGLVLPGILLLLALYQRFNFKQLILTIMPFFLMAACFSVIQYRAQLSNPEYVRFLKLNDYSFVQRILLASYSYIEYQFQLLFPHNIQFWGGYPFEAYEKTPFLLYLYVLFVLIYLFFITQIKKNSILIFCWAFFTLNIIPVTGILPMARTDLIASRYMYIPSMGYCIIMSHIFLTYREKSSQKFKNYINFISLGLVSFYFIYSVFVVKSWGNKNILFP